MNYSVILGCTAVLICGANAVAAESPQVVRQMAQSVTVEMITGNGSGTVISRQGNLYKIVTSRHVVCGTSNCKESQLFSSYKFRMSDGRVYQVPKAGVKLLQDAAGNSLDLATVQFRSDRLYPVAQLADPGSLKMSAIVYTTGFPKGMRFKIGEGKTIAVVNKRLKGDDGGYTIIYNAGTLPGMSGGGVFDQTGKLVAIHGIGDRYRENTQITTVPAAKDEVGTKIGYNRGIPVRWLLQGLADQRSVPGTPDPAVGTTADEYLILGFNKLVEPGDNIKAGKQEAAANFSRAIALNPSYKSAYVLRAYVYPQIEEYAKALADYNWLIKLEPQDPEHYYNRGVLRFLYLNDPQGALADYDRAIAIHPHHVDYFYNRAVLKYLNLEDPSGAISDCDRAIAIQPDFHLAYDLRGQLKSKLGDPQGALADYNQAIAIAPENAGYYLDRGNLKRGFLNDAQGALADFSKAISFVERSANALEPENASLYINRGNLRAFQLGDFQGALADYNRAIAIDPNSADTYLNRGALKTVKLGDHQGALADYDRAIAIDPKHASAYLNRGLLKQHKLNDPKGALADYDRAIESDPKNANAHNSRGYLRYRELGDKPGGITDVRLAARLARAQGNTRILEAALQNLKDWGIGE